MGDFDKNPAASPASEKKKLPMVGVLGAVLVAVVGFEYLKPGPAQASAAAVAVNTDDQQPVVAVPQETAEQAKGSKPAAKKPRAAKKASAKKPADEDKKPVEAGVAAE